MVFAKISNLQWIEQLRMQVFWVQEVIDHNIRRISKRRHHKIHHLSTSYHIKYAPFMEVYIKSKPKTHDSKVHSSCNTNGGK